MQDSNLPKYLLAVDIFSQYISLHVTSIHSLVTTHRQTSMTSAQHDINLLILKMMMMKIVMMVTDVALILLNFEERFTR